MDLRNANCGNCLVNGAEIIKLVDGVCPKCGTDYNTERGNPDDASPEGDPEGGCHCGKNCERGPHEPCPEE